MRNAVFRFLSVGVLLLAGAAVHAAEQTPNAFSSFSDVVRIRKQVMQQCSCFGFITRLDDLSTVWVRSPTGSIVTTISADVAK